MAVVIKTVNIKAPIPIKTVNPPIYGVVEGIKMTQSDILKCLCKHAIIHEVLPDGTLVRLTNKNYFTDNTPPKVEKSKEEPKTEKQIEEEAAAIKQVTVDPRLSQVQEKPVEEDIPVTEEAHEEEVCEACMIDFEALKAEKEQTEETTEPEVVTSGYMTTVEEEPAAESSVVTTYTTTRSDIPASGVKKTKSSNKKKKK